LWSSGFCRNAGFRFCLLLYASDTKGVELSGKKKRLFCAKARFNSCVIAHSKLLEWSLHYEQIMYCFIIEIYGCRNVWKKRRKKCKTRANYWETNIFHFDELRKGGKVFWKNRAWLYCYKQFCCKQLCLLQWLQICCRDVYSVLDTHWFFFNKFTYVNNCDIPDCRLCLTEVVVLLPF
jgi:hypothetical protein